MRHSAHPGCPRSTMSRSGRIAKRRHVLRIRTSNRMTSFAGQTGQIVGRNWDTCGTVRDVSSGKRSEPFFRKDHLPGARGGRPRDRPRSPPGGGMGGARAIGRRCNPALAPMLFPGAVNNHGTKPGVLCACSAPLFGTIAGNIMSLRATPSSTGLKTACLLLLAIVMAGGVRGQPANYPNKPVRIISDGAPGGAIDTNLRIIAERLSKKWAQQVVIENRPGAGGAISATAAAEAPPDGYTIYAPALSVFLTIPGKAPNLPLKLPRDFTAIGITA